jgi:hypothetical protein
MKDIKTKNWGKEQIDLRHLGFVSEVRPIEIYLKEDGSKTNGPSICIVNMGAGSKHTFSQITIEMFNEALGELGYEIRKKDLASSSITPSTGEIGG